MRKSLTICFILFSAGCITPSLRSHEHVHYKPDLEIQHVDGRPMICQSQEDISQLYKKLHECKELRENSK